MGKKNNQGAATAITDTSSNGATEDKPVVNKDKLIKSFETYDKQTAQIENFKKQIEKVTKERSDTVKAILEANGGMQQLVRGGEKITIVSREDSYFLRGVTKSTDGLTEIP